MLSIRLQYIYGNKFESTNKKNCQYHWVNHGEWESVLFIVSTPFFICTRLVLQNWTYQLHNLSLSVLTRDSVIMTTRCHSSTISWNDDRFKKKQFMNKQPNKIFREHACIQINEIQRTVTYNRCPCSFPYLQRVNEMLRV